MSFCFVNRLPVLSVRYAITHDIVTTLYRQRHTTKFRGKLLFPFSILAVCSVLRVCLNMDMFDDKRTVLRPVG